MWDCPKCGTPVDDAVPSCGMCCESPGAALRPRLEPVQRVARPHVEFLHWLDGDPRRPPAGVTRRFGLDRLMLITVLFAVVFALLRTLGAHPAVYAVVAGSVVVVGLAQVFLYGGKKPRRASVVAGMVLGLVYGVAVVSADFVDVGLGHLSLIDGVLVFLAYVLIPVGAMMFGGLCGYLVGCMVAGVFLSRRPGPAQDEDLPPETADPLATVAPETARPDEPPGDVGSAEE